MSINLAQLGKKLKTASSKISPVTAKKLEMLSILGVGHYKRAIQEFHAVDTSTMLNATTNEKIKDTEYLIGSPVHYAPYVALGTSRVRARPFHTVALEKVKQDAQRIKLKPEELGL